MSSRERHVYAYSNGDIFTTQRHISNSPDSSDSNRGGLQSASCARITNHQGGRHDHLSVDPDNNTRFRRSRCRQRTRPTIRRIIHTLDRRKHSATRTWNDYHNTPNCCVKQRETRNLHTSHYRVRRRHHPFPNGRTHSKIV